ncbi:MAG TPA: sigma-70 family RNA polymerase sigma factor [Thermoanaerobaculia bacterium]|nr:sigma-70 family RNA polymerase sigma factor [Thermoanaerobaculia bacterium]
MAAEATPSEDGEARLGARLREGDEVALREVYERFGRVAFGYLLKALGDRAAAEDVQQQVFLEVWRRAASFDPERGTLLTWVMTIARSRAIDQLRRRVPEPVEPETVASAADAGAPSGESELDELAEHWRMRALLDSLPESESELLRLRFYGGFSQSEIAAREDVPLGTVKTRMFSGLRRLREMIEAENGR